VKNEFVDWLKDEALPGVWSKGVALSRNLKSIEPLSPAGEQKELKFKIQTTERMLAYLVTLWPNDQDAHCNCDSKVEPCHHIVAVALAVSSGRVSSEVQSDETTGSKLRYSWVVEPGSAGQRPRITFKRELILNGRASRLEGSLVGYMGGIQSGRIKAPLPQATAHDLKLDSVFAKENPSWVEIFRNLADFPPIDVEGLPGHQTLRVDPKPRRPLLIINRDQAGGILIKPAPNPGADQVFQGGIELWKDQLILQLQADALNERRIPATDLERFFRLEWPRITDQYEVRSETGEIPELDTGTPELMFQVHPLSDDEVSVTARIHYPFSQPHLILLRDLEAEQELHRTLRSQYQLSAQTPVKLDIRSAIQLFDKVKAQGVRAPELEGFVTHFIKNQGLTLEVAQEQKETLMKLLQLRKEKPAAKQKIDFLLRNLNPSTREKPSDDVLVPESLWSLLRDYQKEGVTFLNRNRKELGAALLADDMGLGKTVQTLSILKKPSLIIVPTSLLHNWQEEAKRFRPDLTLQVFHGQARTWNEDADLTLTTYSLLRGEADRFIVLVWDTVVLDEAHQIRNPETQAAVASFQLDANFKLALTGTPVQNRTRDLFSLFQFLSPGLFQDELELDPKLIPAYILRRTKAEVLKELPPKTYLEHFVPFSDAEKKVYDTVFSASKKEILDRLGMDEANPFTLFETLLRARQACDHIGLFDESQWLSPSSKLTRLKELVSELISEGHSVLIYSQWTKFLDRLEIEFQDTSPTLRLDGQTQNRGEVVKDFQSSERPTAFLLSLHAGGVGLNLTRATHVIFCDPWWNPFVELQAEDRAYRMGQEKPVTIHRLLMEGSIEEEIRLLQKEKLKLGEAVLNPEDVRKIISGNPEQRV